LRQCSGLAVSDLRQLLLHLDLLGVLETCDMPELGPDPREGFWRRTWPLGSVRRRAA
jgi:hypothetical protein